MLMGRLLMMLNDVVAGQVQKSLLEIEIPIYSTFAWAQINI